MRTNKAFTLIEVLVVIGIIVIFLVMAIPALTWISGSNSINGAENNISAMLGRVRSDAIALQKDTGVLFFIDPVTKGVMMAEVQATQGAVAGIQTTLDLVPDRDFAVLPKGVGVQVIDNTALSGGGSGTRLDDGYIGYNTTPQTGGPAATLVEYGGVILFDATGKLVSRTYAFRGNEANGTDHTALYNLLYRGKVAEKGTGAVPSLIPPTNAGPPNTVTTSGFGFVLYDRESFVNNSGTSDEKIALTDAQVTNGTYSATELGEETWLDENGTPLMINRYNGTLIRGE